MPIKEFECQQCRKKFDAILGIKEPNPEVCPACGAKDLKQLLSTFKIGGSSKKSSAEGDFSGESPDLSGMGGMGGDDGMMDSLGGMDDAGGMGDMGGGDFGDAAGGEDSAADE